MRRRGRLAAVAVGAVAAFAAFAGLVTVSCEGEHYVAPRWGDAGVPTDGGPPTCPTYPEDPCWVPASWKPGCPIEQALRPGFAMPPLSWRGCPWKANGCLMQDENWPVAQWGGTGGPPNVASTAAGVRVGYLELWKASIGDAPLQRAAVFDPDGAPLAVWRVRPDAADSACTILPPILARDRAWLYGGDLLGQADYVLGAPYAELATASEVSPYHGPSEYRGASNDVLALGWGSRIVFVDRVTGGSYPFGGPEVGTYGEPQMVGNDTALVQCLYSSNRPDGCVWSRALPHVMTRLLAFPTEVVPLVASDGTTLVWIQNPAGVQPGGEYAQGDLWTSPFTTDPAAVVAVKRRPAPKTSYNVTAMAADGYLGLSTWYDEKIHVYRLSDMRHWSFGWGANLYMEGIVHVDAAEVWYWTNSGMVRQRIDALGPGD